jgi:hypothetical protein
MKDIKWQYLTDLPPQKYICGYCDWSVASAKGLPGTYHYWGNNIESFICICPHCSQPTYIEGNIQMPGSKYGGYVEGISDSSVIELYNEARNCMAISSYTASVLCCRKLLMNIAVSKGAKEGLQFIKYVEFLSDNHYVPPDAKDWVDHIRKKGNEATHEISHYGTGRCRRNNFFCRNDFEIGL